MLNVLVGCEESGVVRDAFIKQGHNAVSCDLLPTRSKNLGKHLMCDVKEAIRSNDWDIIILHPDCTTLAVSGNGTYGYGKALSQKRADAIAWTVDLWRLATQSAIIGVCLENPVGVLSNHLGIPQYIQPYNYGHDASKKTGLWLDRLPKLTHKPKDYIEPRIIDGLPRWGNQTDSGQNKLTPHINRKRDRSKTYDGIAAAMADQWGALC